MESRVRSRVCLVAAMLVLTLGRVGFGATVTLDAVAKTVSSDSAPFEAGHVKSKGDQVGAYTQSKSLQPQVVRVRIPGLKDGRYDVYVNWGAFRIKRDQELAKVSRRPAGVKAPEIEPGYVIQGKSAGDLAVGLNLKIPGRVVPTAWMRCMTSAQPALISAHSGIGDALTGYTLGQAVDWVRSAIAAEETYRSVQFFVAPAGTTPSEMDWRSRFTAKGVKQAVASACSLLHDARVKKYQDLQGNALLREATVGALTPVVASFRYYTQNGVSFVRVEIRNNCDLDISGAVDLALPTGWKMQPKRLSFSNLKSGQAYTQAVRLIPPSKGAIAPSSVSATATVKVLKGKTFAKLRIARNVRLGDGTR